MSSPSASPKRKTQVASPSKNILPASAKKNIVIPLATSNISTASPVMHAQAASSTSKICEVSPNRTLFQTLEKHSYARKSISMMTNEARRPAACRSLCDEYIADSNITDLDEERASKVMSSTKVRDIVEERILADMDSDLQTLSGTGEGASILSESKLDTCDKIMEEACNEVSKRVPFLFKVLVRASGVSSLTSDRDERFLAAVYAMLMRQRNQRFNILQRLITATCLRYHAGNQVRIKLNQNDYSLYMYSKIFFVVNGLFFCFSCLKFCTT